MPSHDQVGKAIFSTADEVKTSMQQVGWLWESNVTPFLEFAAAIVHYELSEEELFAYQTELRASDAEEDRWVKIKLPGGKETLIELAQDQGTCVVHVRASAASEITAQLEGVVGFLAIFQASKRGA